MELFFSFFKLCAKNLNDAKHNMGWNRDRHQSDTLKAENQQLKYASYALCFH